MMPGLWGRGTPEVEQASCEPFAPVRQRKDIQFVEVWAGCTKFIRHLYWHKR